MHTLPRPIASYPLTHARVAAHAGGPVVCLAAQAIGQSWAAHVGKPDRIPSALRYVAARDLIRADVVGADGAMVALGEDSPPLLARVNITGPLMSQAGFVADGGPCGGAWVDGYGGEAGIVARMRAALADADVLVTADSPGGSVIGLPECVDAILEAKAQYGRRIYVVIAGWAASAMYWIASCIADPGELYTTQSSMAGNIGARASHCNEAGALAMAGMEITDFAYPPGKIALSPNRAPTEAGIARGNRDVMAAFEMFAAAVGGARPALTRDAIVKLDGDLLTGKAAVKKGLVDAVGDVEAVERWATAQAAAPGEMKMADPKEPEGPPSKPGGQAENEDAEPKAGCAKCGMFRGKTPDGGDAKHCMGCGTAFPEKNDDDEPDSGNDPDALAARGQGVAAASYALMSVPTLRALALSQRRILDGVASRVGARSHAEILGAVDAIKADAVKAQRYRTERNEARTKADTRERIDLLSSLFTADPKGHPRGRLVVDIIDSATNKPTGFAPAPQWGDGPEGRTLANLRAYTRTTLASLTTAERNPFDKPPAEANEEAAQERVNAATVEASKGAPAVRQAADDGIDPKAAAEIYARRFGATAHGVPQ